MIKSYQLYNLLMSEALDGPTLTELITNKEYLGALYSFRTNPIWLINVFEHPSAKDLICESSTAMTAILASSTAMTAIIASSTAMTAIHGSPSAILAINKAQTITVSILEEALTKPNTCLKKINASSTQYLSNNIVWKTIDENHKGFFIKVTDYNKWSFNSIQYQSDNNQHYLYQKDTGEMSTILKADIIRPYNNQLQIYDYWHVFYISTWYYISLP